MDSNVICKSSPYSFEEKSNRLTLRKTQNIYIANSLYRLGEDKLGDKVQGCHSHAVYYSTETGGLSGVDPHDGMPSVVRCHQRFCPVCALMESRKWYSAVYKYVKANPGRFILCTFTVKNVPLADLRTAVQRFNKVYNYLTHRCKGQSKFASAFDGTMRTVEVTYNPVSGTYHPHMHVLCRCSEDYFTNPDKYFDMKNGKLELSRIFSDRLGLDYVAHCSMNVVKDNDNDIAKACAEISKYLFKIPDSLMHPSKHKELDAWMRGVLSLRRVTMRGVAGSLKDILYFVQKESDSSSVSEVLSILSKPFLWVQYKWSYIHSRFDVDIVYSDGTSERLYISQGVPDYDDS